MENNDFKSNLTPKKSVLNPLSNRRSTYNANNQTQTISFKTIIEEKETIGNILN